MNIGVQRAEAFADAGHKCLICGGQASDLHHVIGKSYTQGNAAARELSNSKYLTAPLCRACHSRAHTPTTRTLLLGILIKRYDRNSVAGALEALKAVLRGTLDIELPEGE